MSDHLTELEWVWGPLVRQASPEIGFRGIPFHKVPGKDPKVIEMAVNNRIQYDWWDDSRDSKYQEQQALPEFREVLLPRAKANFMEYNDIIAEASKRLMKRVILFEKSAIPDLQALGFTLKLHKPEAALQGSAYWADYDFLQTVELHDDASNWGNSNIRLTWGFRSWLQINSNWTSSNADNDPKATFAQLIVTHGMRQHTDNPAKWREWVEMRQKYLQDKGWQPS